MIRVMLLAPVLLIMSFVMSRMEKKSSPSAASDRKIAVPWFAFWFLAVIGINSILQSSGFIPSDILDKGTDVVNSFDTFLLTMAMTALGAETSFDKFKKAGIKPFLLAGGLYLWLVAGGYFVALLIA